MKSRNVAFSENSFHSFVTPPPKKEEIAKVVLPYSEIETADVNITEPALVDNLPV